MKQLCFCKFRNLSVWNVWDEYITVSKSYLHCRQKYTSSFEKFWKGVLIKCTKLRINTTLKRKLTLCKIRDIQEFEIFKNGTIIDCRGCLRNLKNTFWGSKYPIEILYLKKKMTNFNKDFNSTIFLHFLINISRVTANKKSKKYEL